MLQALQELDEATIVHARSKCRRKHLLDSKSDDSEDSSPRLKRKQMRKDLHKLKRCMARTGAAAMAASMLGASPVDGVSCMDQASRYRRQQRPLIPELYPELYDDEQPDFNTITALGYSQLTSENDAVSLRCFHESAIEKEALKKSPCDPSTPGLSLTEWDRVSELSDIASETRFQANCEIKYIASSDVLLDGKTPASSEPQGCCVQDNHLSLDGYIDFMACLDDVHAWTPGPKVPKDLNANGVPAPGQELVHTLGDTADEEAPLNNQGNTVSSLLLKKLHGASTDCLELARNAMARPIMQIAAHCKDGVSALANFLGTPPQRVAGNFGSPTEMWLAAQRLVSDDADEQHAAKLFLCCTLGFLVLFALSLTALVLIVQSFMATPCEEVTGSDTGLPTRRHIAMLVMISFCGGTFLAGESPIRDALLSGM
jgi:hypothetical protein